MKGEERKKKNFFFLVDGLARPVPTFWKKMGFFFFLKEKFFFFVRMCWVGFLVNGLKKKKFFVFLNLARTITYKIPENKQKAIKCVGCLPRSARLKSLA